MSPIICTNIYSKKGVDEMAIDKMQMVCVSAPLKDHEVLINEAISLKCYHPVLNTQIVQYTESGIPEVTKNEFIDLKQRIDHLNIALQLGLKEIDTYKKIDIEEAKERISNIEKSYETYLNDRGRKSTDDDLKALKNLESYDIEISENDFISISFGRIPLSTIGSLAKYNQEKFVYTELNRDKYYVWLVYVCLKEDAEHFIDMFKSLYFEPIPIPKKNRDEEESLDLNAMYSYVSYRARQETFEKYIVLDKEMCKFYAFIPKEDLGTFEQNFDSEVCINNINLEIDYPSIPKDFVPQWDKEYYYGRLPQDDYVNLSTQVDFIEVKRDSGYVYVLYGVMPSKDFETRKLLGKYNFAFALMDIEFTLDEEGEVVEKGNKIGNKSLQVPTKLTNNWFFRPFEMLVEMYGVPQYGTFDPTVFFGITYCLLFGIMFGDLGQGIVISLIGAYMFHKKGMVLGAIMERIGVFSAFFGFLYGSVFGNETLLEPILEPLGLPIHVGDSDMTMTLLITAVGLGVILILSSMLINIMVLLRQKRFSEAIYSQNGVAGFMFYGYIIAGVLFNLVAGINIFTPILMIIFLAIPLLMILFSHPLTNLMHKKDIAPEAGWGGYLVESAFELFEVILSFLTNTMSFLRVAGFILSHVGMMMVIMQLHEMSGHAGPLIMIFGNLLVISLEGLIVGIQTLRLEYYEMFSRYYESGGVKFKSI